MELISKLYRREDLARKIRQMLANKQQGEQVKSIVPVSKPSKSALAGSLRILVVEDNLDAQQVLCELLKLLGYAATSVSTAEDALIELDSRCFDVLLTDVSLPCMSGIKLAKKAVEASPALKVIFTSGYGQVETPEFTSYSLPKPYDFSSVRNLLMTLRKDAV